MRNIRNIAVFAIALVFLTSANTHAEGLTRANSKPNQKISSKFSFGTGSDSNVTVSEIDSKTGVRDSFWTFSADVDLKKKISKPTEARIGLSHSQDRFDSFSEFDLGTSLVSAEITHEINKINLGTALRYIVADLDSKKFLSLSQASFNASGLLSKRVFLRADYTYSETEFDVLADRDSTQHALGADLFLFLDGSKQYVIVGYKYQEEDAAADQFDRESHNVKILYQHSVTAFDKPLIGRLKSSYRRRDYQAVTPSIGLIREDERFRAGADLKLMLSDSLFLILEYEYSDYQSNLPAAEYDQSVLALKLGWQNGR